MMNKRPKHSYSMRFSDFAVAFVHSPRRQQLIGLLKTEMDNASQNSERFRIWVFGSVVNSQKKKPGDIDLLISVTAAVMPGWNQITPKNDVQIMSDRASGTFSPTTAPVAPPPKDRMAMVAKFNSDAGNIQSGISISVDDLVEVIADA